MLNDAEEHTPRGGGCASSERFQCYRLRLTALGKLILTK